MTTYTAAVAIVSDCVAGEFCDVTVLENEIVNYRETDQGEEVPEYGMTAVQAMACTETDVRVDDEDMLGKAGPAADVVLAAAGWTRVEGWSVADTAMYALVERD